MTTTLEERPAYAAGLARRRASRVAGVLGAWARSVPWPICLITAVAAALRLAHVEDVAPNQFYDAAVRSMSMSWHNFFFGAFDPAAILSIDKPPLDLWLQVLSVKLFGWGQLALRLPEALGGTLAVPLLYDAVRRAVGRPSALGAAITLAVLPESVLTSRSDTMDSLMMAFVIGALWLTIRASAGGDRQGALTPRRCIVLAGVALGVAFNVKLLEALLVAPALVVFYLLAGAGAPKQKLRHLAAGAGALVAVSAAWAIPASLAPGRTPWPVGSSDGSIWNAMFVFNGFQKASQSASTKPGGPGPFRLLVATDWQYNVLFGCVLLAAVAIAASALLMLVQRRRALGRFSASRSAQGAFAIALAVWIALAVLVFDTMANLHARYLEAVAPAVAAAIGYGASSIAGLTDSPGSATGPASWPSPIPAAFALACIALYTFAFKPPAIAWATCALVIAAVGAVLLARSGSGLALFVAAKYLLAGLIVAGALLFPIHETAIVLRGNANDSLGLAAAPAQNIVALSQYLRPRTSATRYELAVDEPLSLAELIIRDQRPILPLTSFGGRPFTTVEQLRAAVRSGAVRYGLVSVYGCRTHPAGRPGCTSAARWIPRHGIDVSNQVGLLGRSRLYLLAP